MNDKSGGPIGPQIRRLRQERGWTLAELARRAGTSAPTVHRYENGWDRFEVDTLRRIGAALGARLEIRFLKPPLPSRHLTGAALIQLIAPLFWDHDLRASDLVDYEGWVLARVLASGNRAQVRAARTYFGDGAVRRAAERRGVDPRTRQYWRLMLGRSLRASQGSRS